MKTYKEFIKTVKPDLVSAVEQIRGIILKCSKELREEIKWGTPTYNLNKLVCSIHAHKAHLTLNFFNGAKLKSSHLLEGTGKGMRHLKFYTPKDIDKAKIQLLLKEAMEFDKGLGKSK